MVKEFYPLRMTDIGQVRHLLSPERLHSPPDLYSPAVLVMTDFLKTVPVTIDRSVQVDRALDFMKNQQVRLLFVMDDREELLGIITSRDLADSKVLSHMELIQSGRESLTVQDLMLPIEQVKVLSIEQVEEARIGDMMQTLTHEGDAHALVVDQGLAGVKRIRGIVSVSNISRVLHRNFDVISELGSFASREWMLRSVQGH